MPTFGEIADEVAGSHLSELHESSNKPTAPAPAPTEHSSKREGHVIRRFVGHRSEGLVVPRVVSKSEATRIASEYNSGRKPGDPQAFVHKL